jgi:hypothetical protein
MSDISFTFNPIYTTREMMPITASLRAARWDGLQTMCTPLSI